LLLRAAPSDCLKYLGLRWHGGTAGGGEHGGVARVALAGQVAAEHLEPLAWRKRQLELLAGLCVFGVGVAAGGARVEALGDAAG